MKIIREFKIPVCYSVTGRVTIKAESVEDARRKLASPEFINEMPLPEVTDYLEDSFEIDMEGEMIDAVTGQHFPIEE
jgi:hypothetical protein